MTGLVSVTYVQRALLRRKFLIDNFTDVPRLTLKTKVKKSLNKRYGLIGDSMNNTMNDEAVRWVIDQSGKRWAKFTLEYPRFRKLPLWERALKDTFAVMKRTYPSTSIKNQRSIADVPSLLYITYMGGNVSDYSRVQTAFHAQGLIEVLDNDPLLIKLNQRLKDSWTHSVLQTKGMKRATTNPIELEKVFREATVWTEPLTGKASSYLLYTSRGEGNDLGSGVGKIVWYATALPPHKTIRN